MSDDEAKKAERAARAERAAKLRSEKAEREAAYKLAEQEVELQELELDAKYSDELGRRDVDWAMISEPRIGVVVIVKLGTDLGFRKYIDAVNAAEGGVDSADLFEFVAPCVVHPSQEEYSEIVRKRGFIANRCADALAHLHGTRSKKIEGKF